MASNGRYITLDFKSTVNKNTTDYDAEGAWVDSDHVRFRNNRPETQKGWLEFGLNRNFVGVPRDIKVFKELNGRTHIAVGTHRRLEIEQGKQAFDITPIRAEVCATDVIETSSGSTLVYLSVAGHNAASGDEVLISAVSAVGGISFNGETYVVASVASNDRFLVTTETTATGDAQGGGTSDIKFLLAAGEESNNVVGGWGAGSWGTPGATPSSGWDEPRTATVRSPLRQWSLDVWGEDLLASPRGGRVYQWDATTSVTTRAALVTAAPSANNLILVANPKRYLVSYGCTPVSNAELDPLQIRWSDSENFNDWSPSATNEAGGFRVRGGNEIVGVQPTRKEILVLTDKSIYSQRFVGSDFVFGFDLLSNNAGLIAPNAVVETDGIAYWMSRNKFYVYDGRVRKLPCSLEDSLFEDLNFDQKEKIFAGVNDDWDEVIWFYPSKNSEENDKYVVFNIAENAWYGGTIERTVWEDVGLLDAPVATNASGNVFSHNLGDNNAGGALEKFIESAYTDLDEGTDVVLVDQIVPDFNVTEKLQITIFGKRFPNDTAFQKGPYTVSAGTEVINMRFRARQAKIRYSTSAIDGSFDVGRVRFRVRPDGER